MVDRLNATRNELLVIVRDLPADLRLAPVLDDKWSTKDLIGRIASWENRLLTLAQMLINGEGDKIEWIGDNDTCRHGTAQRTCTSANGPGKRPFASGH